VLSNAGERKVDDFEKREEGRATPAGANDVIMTERRPAAGDGDLRCPVCQDTPAPARRPMSTGCGHILCGLCAGRAFGKERMACPVCRARVRALTSLAARDGALAPGAKVARVKYCGIVYVLDVAEPPLAGGVGRLLGGESRDWATALRLRVETMFGLRADRMRLICKGRAVALGRAAATGAAAGGGAVGVAAEAFLDGKAAGVLVATAKENQEDFGVPVVRRVAGAVAATRAFQWLLAALLAVWSVVRLFFESLLPIRREGDPVDARAAVDARRDGRGRPPGGAGGAGDGGFGFRG